MRHLLTILVLWTQGYLFAPELMRLPTLLAHYLEHLDVEGAVGFEHFLALHYNSDSHDAQAPDEHDDLPFHHHHGAAIDPCCMKLITTDPTTALSFPKAMMDREPVVPPKDDPLSGFRSTLLQPPRQLA